MAGQSSSDLLNLNPPGVSEDEAAGKARADVKLGAVESVLVDDPSLLLKPDQKVGVDALPEGARKEERFEVRTSGAVSEEGGRDLVKLVFAQASGSDGELGSQLAISELGIEKGGPMGRRGSVGSADEGGTNAGNVAEAQSARPETVPAVGALADTLSSAERSAKQVAVEEPTVTVSPVAENLVTEEPVTEDPVTDDEDDLIEVSGGQNPGNNKDVGNSKFDGQTGASDRKVVTSSESQQGDDIESGAAQPGQQVTPVETVSDEMIVSRLYEFTRGDYESGHTQNLGKIKAGDTFDLGKLFLDGIDNDLSDNLLVIQNNSYYELWVDIDGATETMARGKNIFVEINTAPWTKLVTFDLDPGVQFGVDKQDGLINFSTDVSGLENLPISEEAVV